MGVRHLCRSEIIDGGDGAVRLAKQPYAVSLSLKGKSFE